MSETKTIRLDATSAAYDIVSWMAIIKTNSDAIVIVDIEMLREIVRLADADVALLAAKEEGTA